MALDQAAITALYEACWSGDTAAVSAQAAAAAAALTPADHPVQWNSQSPLSVAIEQRHAHIVSILLEAGCAATPELLTQSIAASTPDVVRLLLAAGANPSVPNNPAAGGQTALHLAVDLGHAELLPELLASPQADPNTRDADGLTALHRAASAGNFDLCLALATHPRTRLDATTIPGGATAADLARMAGHEGVADLLLDLRHNQLNGNVDDDLAAADDDDLPAYAAAVAAAAAADNHPPHPPYLPQPPSLARFEPMDLGQPQPPADLVPLQAAAALARDLCRHAHFGQVAEMQQLLASAPAPGLLNAPDPRPDTRLYTPLHWACQEAKVEVVRFLLAQPGIDLGALDEFGGTALHAVVRKPPPAHNADADTAAREQIVRLLLQTQHTLVNAQTHDGRTAMHYAAAHACAPLIKALLYFWADPSLFNNAGETPADCAPPPFQHTLNATLHPTRFHAYHLPPALSTNAPFQLSDCSIVQTLAPPPPHYTADLLLVAPRHALQPAAAIAGNHPAPAHPQSVLVAQRLPLDRAAVDAMETLQRLQEAASTTNPELTLLPIPLAAHPCGAHLVVFWRADQILPAGPTLAELAAATAADQDQPNHPSAGPTALALLHLVAYLHSQNLALAPLDPAMVVLEPTPTLLALAGTIRPRADADAIAANTEQLGQIFQSLSALHKDPLFPLPHTALLHPSPRCRPTPAAFSSALRNYDPHQPPITPKLRRLLQLATGEHWINLLDMLEREPREAEADPVRLALIAHAERFLGETEQQPLAEPNKPALAALPPADQALLHYLHSQSPLSPPAQRYAHASQFLALQSLIPGPDLFPTKWLDEALAVPAPPPERRQRADAAAADDAAADGAPDGPKNAKERWALVKASRENPPAAVDKAMELIGLEEVKNIFIDIFLKYELNVEQGSTGLSNMNCRFEGNPGTGKTTIANIYAEFLIQLGVLPDKAEKLVVSAANLIDGGVADLKKKLDPLKKAGGGVVFIDEAYQLSTDRAGRQVLDFLLTQAERIDGGDYGRLVWVLAGYKKDMEKLFEHNEGLPRRFPFRFIFADYSDEELEAIIHKVLKGLKGKQPFRLEDDKHGRIAARRLGAMRGTPGFGNAGACITLVERAQIRQSARITAARSQGETPDIFLLTRDDLLGPKASRATLLAKSHAYRELQAMIGLKKVKQAVDNIVEMAAENAEREELEQKLIKVSLNRVFLGPPGVGKTTVGALFGRILADIGLLSKGECLLKNPSDFVGDVIGSSEKKTREILKQAMGCCLIIDEAYGLHTENGNDPYKTAIIDTLVEQIQNRPGEDRAVLMLGYERDMETMMRNSNPGLARRFDLANAFVFEDFNDMELIQILRHKAKARGMPISLRTARAGIKCLAKARAMPNFGNAGSVENLLSQAMLAMQQRGAGPTATLEAADFETASEMVAEDAAVGAEGDLFAGLVGIDDVVAKMREMRSTIEVARREGRDWHSRVEMCFRFTGSPGTGKTSVARRMGRMFHLLGILPTAEVLERSATDFVTGYVGQAGQRTMEVLRESLGKVLFIDEAYELNPEVGGKYMEEVVTTLVKSLTLPEFKNKLVVILAGYEGDMEELMRVNPGLKSRFSEKLLFRDFDPALCKKILLSNLQKENLAVPPDVSDALEDMVQRLKDLGSFGNGRDMEQWARRLFRKYAQRVVDVRDDAAADVTGQLVAADFAESLEELIASKHEEASEWDNERDRRRRNMQAAGAAAATVMPMAMAPQMAPPRMLPQMAPPQMAARIEELMEGAEDLDEEEEEEEEPRAEAAVAAAGPKDPFDSLDADFVRSMQDLMEAEGLDSEEGSKRLRSAPSSGELLQRLARELAQRLGISKEEALEKIEGWKGAWLTVDELVEKQREEEEAARRAAEEAERKLREELARAAAIKEANARREAEERARREREAQRRKVVVKIWRCRVCGRANMPYIVCWVAPYVVREEVKYV